MMVRLFGVFLALAIASATISDSWALQSKEEQEAREKADRDKDADAAEGAANEVINRAERSVRETRDHAKDAVNDVVDNAESDVRDLLQNAEDAVNDVIDNAESGARDLLQNAEDAVNDVIDRAERTAAENMASGDMPAQDRESGHDPDQEQKPVQDPEPDGDGEQDSEREKDKKDDPRPEDEPKPEPEHGIDDPVLQPANLSLIDFFHIDAFNNGDVSDDGKLAIEFRRDSLEDDFNMRSLWGHVRIKNSGPGYYIPGNVGQAEANLSVNEGPGQYSTEWTEEDNLDLPAMDPGEIVALSFEIQLRGAYTVPLGEWAELMSNYQYVLIESLVDVGNNVAEAGEGNNQIGPYCYDAADNRFVTMSFCGP